MENTIPKAVAAKIFKTMQLIGKVEKSGTNQQQNYKFQPWNEIQFEVRKAMCEAGLICLTSITSHTVDQIGQTQKGNPQYRHFVTLGVSFADAETGKSWASTWHGEAFETGDKGLQKAATSALKYCLLKTFLISDKEDSDPDAATPEPAKPKPAPKPVKSDDPHADEKQSAVNLFESWGTTVEEQKAIKASCKSLGLDWWDVVNKAAADGATNFDGVNEYLTKLITIPLTNVQQGVIEDIIKPYNGDLGDVAGRAWAAGKRTYQQLKEFAMAEAATYKDKESS